MVELTPLNGIIHYLFLQISLFKEHHPFILINREDFNSTHTIMFMEKQRVGGANSIEREGWVEMFFKSQKLGSKIDLLTSFFIANGVL